MYSKNLVITHAFNHKYTNQSRVYTSVIMLEAFEQYDLDETMAHFLHTYCHEKLNAKQNYFCHYLS